MKWYKYSQRNILLTGWEKAIFALLNQCKDVSNKLYNSEMIVAGGWVRDKLMDKNSDDIDIAVNGIYEKEPLSGLDFAEEIYKISKDIVPFNVENVIIEKVSSPHKLNVVNKSSDGNEDSNPALNGGALDISGKINGQSMSQKIEFIRMRTESYDPNSRQPIAVPSESFEEDAMRRDLTINNMGFNIKTRRLHDSSGGLEDLNNGVLRTPIDPRKTLMEDPLRALRVIRFHSRYPNSKIDPEIIKTMSSNEFHNSYMKKVAPSRAGDEILKMSKSPNPENGMRVLFETDFYKPVFQIPEDYKHISMDQKNRNHKLNLMNHTLDVIKNVNSLMKNENEKDRQLMVLSAIFHDFGKMHPNIQQPHHKNEGEMSYLGHEDASSDFANNILTKLGVGEKERKFVNKVIEHHMYPHVFESKEHKEKDLKPKTVNKFFDKTNIPGMDQEDLEEDWKKRYRRIPEFVWLHGEADNMSKGEESFDSSGYQRRRKQISDEILRRNERMSLKDILGEKPGKIIMRLIPEMRPQDYMGELNPIINNAYNSGQIQNYQQFENIVLNWKRSRIK